MSSVVQSPTLLTSSHVDFIKGAIILHYGKCRNKGFWIGLKLRAVVKECHGLKMYNY